MTRRTEGTEKQGEAGMSSSQGGRRSRAVIPTGLDKQPGPGGRGKVGGTFSMGGRER